MTRVTACDNAHPNTALLDEMFRARKRLFTDRLGWPVSGDCAGRETDRYDALDPLYLIATDGAGRHVGSLRLLRTTGETMLHDHFSAMLDGVALASPEIWECSRFCIDGEDSDTPVSTTALHVEHVTNCLLLGLCETALARGMTRIVGMFDQRTLSAFRHSGWSPDAIGQSGDVFLGIWNVSADSAASIRQASGITGAIMHPANLHPRRSGAA